MTWVVGAISGFALLLAHGCGGQQLTEAPGDAGVDAPTATLADKLLIDSLDLNQGVQITFAKDGLATKANAPVVAARPAFVRLGVLTQGGRWAKRVLDAELHLSAGGKEIAVLKDSKMIVGPSSAVNLSTTFNFTIDAAKMTTDVSCSVIVRDPAMATEQPGSTLAFPSDGSTIALGAQASTAHFKVKIVPVEYRFSAGAGDAGAPLEAGAPGLFPDTSAEQIQRYHDTLYKMYPTANVDMTVRSSMPWTKEILPDGTGWDDLIVGIMDLRAQDNEADDVYYVGVFIAAESESTFCSMGCVLGVAQLSDAADVSARMALVVGYTGDQGPNTLNQELAHALGREHAKCGGADSPDPLFPYPRAGIGVFGYDLLAGELIDPDGPSRDFMGYCEPIWISDYTYAGLFKRLAFVNKQKRVLGDPRKYRSVHVGRDGSLRWGSEVTLTSEPVGETMDIAMLSGAGSELRRTKGHFYRHDTIGGGFALVPDVDSSVARMRITMANRVAEVARP